MKIKTILLAAMFTILSLPLTANAQSVFSVNAATIERDPMLVAQWSYWLEKGDTITSNFVDISEYSTGIKDNDAMLFNYFAGDSVDLSVYAQVSYNLQDWYVVDTLITSASDSSGLSKATVDFNNYIAPFLRFKITSETLNDSTTARHALIFTK